MLRRPWQWCIGMRVAEGASGKAAGTSICYQVVCLVIVNVKSVKMCSSSKKVYRADQKKSEETIEIVKGAQAESSKMRYIDPAKTETTETPAATAKRFVMTIMLSL